MLTFKFILFVTLSLSLSVASDSKADKLADDYRKAERKLRSKADEWTAYCKGKDLVPDMILGCAPVKPSTQVPTNTTTEVKK